MSLIDFFVVGLCTGCIAVRITTTTPANYFCVGQSLLQLTQEGGNVTPLADNI